MMNLYRPCSFVFFDGSGFLKFLFWGAFLSLFIPFVDAAPAITAGGYHACVITFDENVKCWGKNDHGQLGNGSDVVFSGIPLDVVGIGEGVSAISAGSFHTCVVTNSGGAKCWGLNFYGALGDGGEEFSSSVPVDVFGLSDVTSIAAGFEHTCALVSGSVKCWGSNAYGQLGDGSQISSVIPVDVEGFSGDVVAIDVAGYRSCALTDLGFVKCWGDLSYGQNNPVNFTKLPIDIVGLADGVASFSISYSNTCVITKKGVSKCVGANFYGQLGRGYISVESDELIDVYGLNDFNKIVSSGTHVCAIVEAGSAKCWGYNANGELGIGVSYVEVIPQDVIGFRDSIVDIDVGSYYTCVITTGSVQCWGTIENSSLPVVKLNFCISGAYLHEGACAILDSDGDGVPNILDNCLNVVNADQLDMDGDSQGNVCDLNDDNDVNIDVEELACGSNPLSASSVCDMDFDGLWNEQDNCPFASNHTQLDTDNDGLGDVCDFLLDKDKNGLDDIAELAEIELQIQDIQSVLNTVSAGKEAVVNQYKGLLDSASNNADLAIRVSASIQSSNTQLADRSVYYAQRRAEGASKAELKIIANEQKVLKKQIKALQKIQKNYLKAEKKLLSQAAKLAKKNKLSAEVTALAAQIQAQEDLLLAKKAELGM